LEQGSSYLLNSVYVDSGGARISNTINKAELTGIASALRAKYT